MCGIFGFMSGADSPVKVKTCVTALNTMRHRGPDDEGHLLVDFRTDAPCPCKGPDTHPSLSFPEVHARSEQSVNVYLGHRRLAIIDLSPAGHQPMPTGDDRYWIVCNGEIYNYLELRDDLKKSGHVFRTATDTEVILAAYQEWGPAMLPRFVGMFALAILDIKQKKIFLARDCFGIKPLYYTTAGGPFAFASEIGALLALPDVSRQANPQRVYDYLRFALTDHGDRTMLADIDQLPAAHYLEWDIRTGSITRMQPYWHLDTGVTLDISFEEAASTARELFLKNVALHMRSDVPTGACLSGGIDSSAIVMAMRHHQGTGLALRTVSVLFEDADIDERPFVDRVVQAVRSESYRTEPVSADLVRDLDRLIARQGEPFGSTSIYAQQQAFRLAGEIGLKVMLDGQGADEILGGYFRYLTARLASLVKQGRWRQAGTFLKSMDRLPQISQIQMLKELATFFIPPEWQARLWRGPGTDLMASYMNKFWLQDRQVDLKRPTMVHFKTDRVLRETLVQSLFQTSLPMLLRYEDRNAMAYGIESRVPFLVPDFVQFIYSLQEDYIITPQGETKSVFRRAMRGLVPDMILDRRDKIGFATPEGRWLEAEKAWIDRVFQDADPGRLAPLNLDRMIRDWEDVKRGVRPYHASVWLGINTIRWAQLNDIRFD